MQVFGPQLSVHDPAAHLMAAAYWMANGMTTTLVVSSTSDEARDELQ